MTGLRLDACASGRTLLVVLGKRSGTRPTTRVVSPADALAQCGRPTGRRGQPELSSSEVSQRRANAAAPTDCSVGITRTIPCELVRAPLLRCCCCCCCCCGGVCCVCCCCRCCERRCDARVRPQQRGCGLPSFALRIGKRSLATLQQRVWAWLRQADP